MKDILILMTGEMVRAIRAGRKTLTSRIIKRIKLHEDYGQPNWNKAWIDNSYNPPCLKVQYDGNNGIDTTVHRHWCPYGVPGDRLVIREAYQITNGFERSHVVEGFYLADKADFEVQFTEKEWDLWSKRKKPYAKTSGMFMYKSLARLRPPIVSVRVERLQDISEEDAKAEGRIKQHNCFHDSIPSEIGNVYRRGFAYLWDSIHGQGAWERNDFVWRIEFERVKP